MSRVLTCIWVTSGHNNEIERLIKRVTRSQFAHAAVSIDFPGKGPVIFEATGSGLHFSDINRFDGASAIETSEIELDEDQYNKVCRRMLELEGKPYGKDDCIIGGAHDLGTQLFSEKVGETISTILDRYIDNEESYNCSQTQVEIVKAAYAGYGDAVNNSKLTPEQSRLLKYSFFRND